MRGRVKPKVVRSKCQRLMDMSYDILTCVLAAVDVVSDVIIAWQFYQQQMTVFFYCSLFFLFIAQVCYSIMFVLAFCNGWRTNAQWVAFFVIFPFAQLVPLMIWIASLEIKWIDGLISALGMRFQSGPPRNNLGFDDDDPLREWLMEKVRSHLGFIVETVVESVPQAILQMVAIVVSGHASTINIFSLIISLISVASKGLMLSYSVHRPTFVWNILCFCMDVFSIFCTISWCFVNTPGYALYDVPFFSHQFHYWSSWLIWKEIIIIGAIIVSILCGCFAALVHAQHWHWPRRDEIGAFFVFTFMAILLFFPFMIVAEALCFTILPMILFAQMEYTTRNAAFFRDLTNWVLAPSSNDGMLARLRSTNWYMSRRSLLQHQNSLVGHNWNHNSTTLVQARQDYKVFQLMHPSKFKLVPTATTTSNNKKNKICPKGKAILQPRTLRIHHPWTPSLLREALRSPILQGRSWHEVYVEARASMRNFQLRQHITLRNFSAALVFFVITCVLAPVFLIGKVFVLLFPLISWLATPTVIADPSLALVSDVTAAVTGDVSAAGGHGWLLDGGVAVGVGVLQRTLLTITTIILIGILVLLPAVLRFIWYHYHITHWHQVPRNASLMNDIKADHEHAYQPILVYHHLVGDSIESLDGSDELSTLLAARKLLKHLTSSTSSSSSSSNDVNGDYRHPQILPDALAQIVASYCNVVADGVIIPTIGDDTPWIKGAYTSPWSSPSSSPSSPAVSPSITSRSISKYRSQDYLRTNRKAAATAAAMANSESSSTSLSATKAADPTVAPISPTASSMSSSSGSSSSGGSGTVAASSVLANHIAQRAQMAAAIEKRLNKVNSDTTSDRSTCIGSSSGSSSSSNSSDSSTSSTSSVVTNGSENDNKDNSFDIE